MDVIRSTLDNLFQIALLLVADPDGAEKALRDAVEALDISTLPGQNAVEEIQRHVIVKSLPAADLSAATANVDAYQLLQPGLLPVLKLANGPRICFVLIFLIGYTRSCCAQLLGLEEESIQPLLNLALLQMSGLATVAKGDAPH